MVLSRVQTLGSDCKFLASKALVSDIDLMQMVSKYGRLNFPLTLKPSSSQKEIENNRIEFVDFVLCSAISMICLG